MITLLLIVLVSAILAYGYNLHHLEEKEEMRKKFYSELEEQRQEKYFIMDMYKNEVEELKNTIARLRIGGK